MSNMKMHREPNNRIFTTNRNKSRSRSRERYPHYYDSSDTYSINSIKNGNPHHHHQNPSISPQPYDNKIFYSKKNQNAILDIISYLIETNKPTKTQNIFNLFQTLHLYQHIYKTFNGNEHKIKRSLKCTLYGLCGRKNSVLRKNTINESFDRGRKFERERKKLNRKCGKTVIRSIKREEMIQKITNIKRESIADEESDDEPNMFSVTRVIKPEPIETMDDLSTIKSDDIDYLSIKYDDLPNLEEDDDIECTGYGYNENEFINLSLCGDMNVKFCPICKKQKWRTNWNIENKCSTMICYNEGGHRDGEWVYWCWECTKEIPERMVTTHRGGEVSARCLGCAAISRRDRNCRE